MSEINDKASTGLARGKLQLKELQPYPGAQPPSRTTSFKDVDSEIRKQRRIVSDWLSIDQLIPESNELVKQIPEVLDTIRDIKEAISRVQSYISPGMHFPPQSEITYLDLVIELRELKSKIAQLRENCDDILSGPKYKVLPRWPRGKNRRKKIEAINKLQARLRDVTRTLDLLIASMTITAALDQKSFGEAERLSSITKALRDSPQPKHIVSESGSALGQQVQKSTNHFVFHKEQARQLHETTFSINQRFDSFHGQTINKSNFAVKGVLDSDLKHLSVGDEHGNTPLHEAARYGFEDVVRTLLSAGASVVVKNKSNMTPAEHAIHYGQTQSFVLIFEHMAATNAFGENSMLVFDYCGYVIGKKEDRKRLLDLTLFYAIRTSNVVIARYLLKRGADPNGFNDEGTPVLHHAIRYSKLKSEDQFSFSPDAFPEMMLLHGADPDIMSKDNKKESALHVAIRWGKLGTVRRLLKYGVNPRNKNFEGQPPLFAMFDKEPKVLDYNYRGIIMDMVNRGADLNQPDDNDRLVLHLAAQNGVPYAIWVLIRLGAACDLPDAAGKVPLDYAKETNDQLSIDLLESYTPRSVFGSATKL
ncbi:ankyrin repeat-containing domain protein [Xylaria scruposa]|nr:ankyrin repeat-containing domain protein [Xylaria scruposa]